MILIPLEEEHVSLKLKLCILHLFVFMLHFFGKFVALVVPTSAVVMIFPVSHAKPAEVLATHLAGHVIATLILLNGLEALFVWALFRIGHNPSYVL